MTIDVLLLGGRGQIGSGLRIYLPRLDPGYRFTSVDLPGSPDKAAGPVPGRSSSTSTSPPSRPACAS